MKNLLKISLLSIFLFLLFEPVNAGIFSFNPDSINISFDKNQLVLPGETFKIGVTSFHPKGKIKKTKGQKGGSVFWSRYNVEVVGGTFSHGKIQVNSKLTPSKGKYISLKVWPIKKKKLLQTILIPLNYETKISFVPTTKFDKAPGCSFKGRIVAQFNNGVVRKYSDVKKKNIAGVYEIYTYGIDWKKKWFGIDSDFRNIVNHEVAVSVVSVRNPDVACDYAIKLDYKHNYQLYSRGFSGFRGEDGADGVCGYSGGNGQHGEYGYNGGVGEDGHDFGVWTDRYFDSTLNCTLLYTYAQDFISGQEYYYLINPDGGSLTVVSRGGDGGEGGDGGDGGDGGNGEDGRIWYETVNKTRTVKKPFTKQVKKKVTKTSVNEKGETVTTEEYVTEEVTVYKDVEETYQVQIKHQERGQDGGHGGDGGGGGLGGLGGWGGNIQLFFTDDAYEYQYCIEAESVGGNGGINGDGGRGGLGGYGGHGDPNGNNGQSGWDGPEKMGWSSDGYDGGVTVQHTDEFFFY